MTWSPTQGYIKANNSNPLEIIFDEVKSAWETRMKRSLLPGN
jgi:hypothetical protein